MVKFNGPKKSKLCLKISKEIYFIYLKLYNSFSKHTHYQYNILISQSKHRINTFSRSVVKSKQILKIHLFISCKSFLLSLLKELEKG